MTDYLRILVGDCRETLRTLDSESVQMCVTSPPYWGLRDYGNPGQIGLERTPDEYIGRMLEVFAEVWRVLKPDATLWLNLGDCYNACNGNAGPGSGFSRGAACDTERPKLESGHGLRTKGLKPKDLVGIPWRMAFALQREGWYLRSDIIWHKPNPMPESVTDRPTKAHEYIFLLTKSERYFYDDKAVRETCSEKTQWTYSQPDKAARLGFTTNGTGKSTMRTEAPDGLRNRRSVWTIPTQPYNGAHFATYPPELIRPCILAGSRTGDTVLDPFGGSGTTGMVALNEGRRAILCELNPAYVEMIERRTTTTIGLPI